MEGIRLSLKIDEIAELGTTQLSKSDLDSQLNLKLLELHCLYHITAILSEKMDLKATIDVTKRIFKKIFPLDHYTMFLIDKAGENLVLKNWFGFRRSPQAHARFALDQDIFGAALQNSNSIYINNIEKTSKQFSFYPEIQDKKGSILCLPLLSETTEAPLGAINLYRNEIDGFTQQERQLFDKISQQVARVLDKVLIYHQTQELSVTDDLTRLANRRYFNQRFEHEIQRSQRYTRDLSIIMIDIDHFKNFNDTNGHLQGDEVLRVVAKILEQNLRKADLVARFGGEEFVVMLPEIDKSHAQKAAEKLRIAIESHPFKNGQAQPLGKITISLGLASFPEDAFNGRDLLEAADNMLYLAKSMGRNQVGFIDERNSKSDKNQSYEYNIISSR